MKFVKPKPNRVYVNIVNPDDRTQDQHFTIYNTTPAKVRTLIEKAANKADEKQQPVASA